MRFFPPAFLDELRARLPVSQVVGRHVQLKRSAPGEFSGLCPFHKEKTPSFTVSDKKGFYHCFGCGAHGSVIDFATQYERKTFPEAVEALAQQAGLPLPEQDKQAEQRYQKRQTLYDVTEAACAWFRQQLLAPAGRAALGYLRERGIHEATLVGFRLGYAPDSFQAMQEALVQQGFSLRQLVQVGLCKEGGREGHYSTFRDRVIFPIRDEKGRVIAFGGRALGDGQPKYLNSPETELFHKGKVLYGMDKAREAAYTAKTVIIAEGYMDVIALHQAGVPHAVAPLGTAVTRDHLALLWTLAEEPVFCLDGDEAGKRAMAKVAHLALPVIRAGQSLRFVSLPAGMDPDDMVRQYGARAMRDLLAKGEVLSDIVWQLARGGSLLATPEQKSAMQQRLMELVETVQDMTLRSHYRKAFLDRLWPKKTYHRGGQANHNGQGDDSRVWTTAGMLARPNPRIVQERVLLAMVLRYPELLDDPAIEDQFMHMELMDSAMAAIHQAIAERVDGEGGLVNLREKEAVKEFLHHALHDTYANGEIARAGWHYCMEKYTLILMEQEQEQALLEDADKAFGLLNQLNMQKELVEMKKIAYEAMLD